MYKILVVDDEILTVEFLCGLIPWEKFNCKIEGTALTANQAFRIVQEIRPDIIFMDIRMPKMDGIQLSKKILEFHPDCHIIVLTAYQDFNAAKAAIQIGVGGFILKHELDEKSLAVTLNEAIYKLSKQREMQSMILKKWLYNTIVNSAEIEFPRGHHHQKGTQYIFLLVIAERCFHLLPAYDSGYTAVFEDIGGCGFLKDKNLSLLEVSHLEGSTYGLLCSFFPQVSSKGTYDLLLSGIKSLEKEINLAISGNCSIVAAGPVNAPIKLTQINLKPILNEVMLCSGSVLTEKDYFNLPVIEPVFPERFVDAVIEHIHMRSPEVSNMIHAPFLHLPNQGRCAVDHLLPVKSLLERFNRMYINRGIPLFKPPDKLSSLIQLSRWISHLANELILVQGNLYSKNHSLAAETMKYIENAYGSDLSVEDIAKSLYVSSGHLRTVFKKELGCTVNEYLLKVRIGQAKRLLLEKDKKIYEIAALCGFKTSQYFSTAFKSAIGISPKEFMYGYVRD